MLDLNHRLLPALGIMAPGAAFGCTAAVSAERQLESLLGAVFAEWRLVLLLCAFSVVVALLMVTMAITLGTRYLLLRKAAPGGPHALAQPALAACLAVTALALGLIGSFGVPAFEQVYASFGVELPRATRVLTVGAPGLWLPTACLLASLFIAKTLVRIRLLMALTLASQACLLALVLWALYMPIQTVC